MEYEERLRDSLLDAIADSAAASQLSAQDTPALTMQQASSTTSSAAVSFNVQDVHDLLQQDDSSIPLSSQPELVGEGESYQFGLLVGAAAAYVGSAWWIVAVRP